MEKKLNGDPIFVHAPAFPQIKEDYDFYMNRTAVIDILELRKKIEIAIISIGTPPVNNPDSVVPNIFEWRSVKIRLCLLLHVQDNI